MSSSMQFPPIATAIWHEEAEPDDPFSTRLARCSGYDVFGEMLGQAHWADMLYLLFRGQAPSASQARLLESLAVALANPGPRDQSVHAAMCGGIGGSTSASCLIAALAVGAGHLGGSREVFLAMESWQHCGCELTSWEAHLTQKPSDIASIWPAPQHPSGFEPHAIKARLPVLQTLAHLAECSPGSRLSWLNEHRQQLETIAGFPLSLSGVAAAAFADLDLSPEQGEMLYLLLRLPGAAAHALEQKQQSHKNFPFFALELQNGTPEEEV
ncbi:MAG TPA: citryl-CoA lyase [Azonexus sp.]|nr:citryl-CoA lyase [Azonexus sp.]